MVREESLLGGETWKERRVDVNLTLGRAQRMEAAGFLAALLERVGLVVAVEGTLVGGGW